MKIYNTKVYNVLFMLKKEIIKIRANIYYYWYVFSGIVKCLRVYYKHSVNLSKKG